MLTHIFYHLPGKRKGKERTININRNGRKGENIFVHTALIMGLK